jgi:Holliday junction resolvase RusA-like endonuclease
MEEIRGINEIKIVIDKKIVGEYNKYYFLKYPKRKKVQILKPIPPSLNDWMIMPRFKMNSQKQAWKEFGEWLVDRYGYVNKNIDKCNIEIEYFFDSHRRHDADNYTPKNLFDSFTKSGLLIDDDFDHVESLLIKGNYSKENPRMEISILFESESKGDKNDTGKD